jgi:glycosyltransferase involved in cell wall biosynthesis
MNNEHERRVIVANYAWLPESETFVARQVASLSRWKPHVFAFKSVASKSSDAVSVDATCLRDSLGVRLAFQVLGFSNRTKTLFRTVQPRLVHVHFLTTAAAMLPFLERAQVPFVVTAHGYDATVHKFTGKLMNWTMKRRLKSVFDNAEQVLCVSNYIRNCVIERGCPARKAHVHYLGIPIPNVTRQKRCMSRVLFVGRLVPKKGLLKLIRAIAEVRVHCKGAHLRVIGEGPEKPEAQRLSTQLNVPIEWLGWQSHQRVLEEMAEAEVFCMPSSRAPNGDNEGLGLVYLEAQAMETPVVAFNQGPVSEAVQHGATGLLAQDGDLQQLATHLGTLLQNSETARSMGAAGRKRVRTHFNVVEKTGELEALYDACVDKAR